MGEPHVVQKVRVVGRQPLKGETGEPLLPTRPPGSQDVAEGIAQRGGTDVSGVEEGHGCGPEGA